MASKPKSKTKRTAPLLFKPRKIRIKVVGIGGGGSSMVAEMAQRLRGPSFVFADTDVRVFKKVRSSSSSLRGAKRRSNLKVFHFGQKLLEGMGTGMDPDIAQRAALEEKERLAKIFQGEDLVILVGSLGGGVASGAGPVFAEICKNQRHISLGIFTLPFNFEGEKKQRLAKKALYALRENLSGIVIVPNEKIFNLIDRKTPLKKALSTLNQVFVDWLSDLITIISKPNLINIDFADLRTVLKERGQELYFDKVVAQGPNRAEDLLKRAFENPLFDKPPSNAKRILFNITGGKDLGLKEVEKISQCLAHTKERAKIIFGVSETPQYTGKIKLTLLAVTSGENATFAYSQTFAEGRRSQTKQPAAREREISKKKGGQKKPTKGLKAEKVEKRNKLKQKTRRSALELKEIKEKEEQKEWAGEPEWGIPAFLRKNIE